MTKKIGIIGGYSDIGRHCAKALSKYTNMPLLIAGRHATKAIELAKTVYQAEGYQLDIFNEQQLDSFCAQCSIIINCAGPSTVILDTIALMALKHNCHYIDIGGYDILYDLLAPRSATIREKGLSFLISTGWIPGVSGVFPMYMAMLAEMSAITISSMEIFISGKEKWSYGSCRDMIWAMFEDFSGAFENGAWVRKNIFTHSRKIVLPPPSGKQWAYPMFNNQLKDFAITKKYPLLAEYMGSEEFSFRTTLLIMYIKAFMKKNKDKAAAMFQKAINRDMQHATPSGIVHVIIKGADNRITEGSLFTHENNRLTGATPAIAASLLINGAIQKRGLSYFCDSVDPIQFMGILQEQGFGFSVSADLKKNKTHYHA